MTKKDFELIASVISNMDFFCKLTGAQEAQLREEIALEFAHALAKTHLNFNQERFMKACEVKSK